MSDVLNSQAAAGVKSTRREIRALLERVANEFAVVNQFYGREVVLSSTDANRVLAFEASLKGLYDSAADRPTAVVSPTPVAVPAPVAAAQ